MEELIWKYVDNICTEEEKIQVQLLLNSDQKFKSQFDSINDLNNQLMHVSVIPMSESNRVKIAQSMTQELKAMKAEKQVEVLPLKWIIALSLVSVIVIIYAYTMPQSQDSLLTFLPKVDEKVISIGGWICMSFIMLTLLDAGLKRIHEIRKYTGFIY